MSRKKSSGKSSIRKAILRGALTTGAVKFSGVGVAFLFMVYLAFRLDVIEFGIFASSFSLAMILGPIASLGQQSAVLRFWPAFEQSYGRGVANFTILNGIRLAVTGGGGILVLGTILTYTGHTLAAFGNDPQIWIAIAVLSGVFSLSEVTLASLRAMGKVGYAFIPRDVIWRILVIIFIEFFLKDRNSLTAMWVCSIVLFSLVIIQLVVVQRVTSLINFSGSKQRANHKDLKEIKRSLVGFWGNSIMSQLQQQGATVVVGLSLGPLEAGAFFAASRLANLLSIIQLASNQISAPMMSRAWSAGEKGQVAKIMELTILSSVPFSAIGCIIFVFLGGRLLSIFDADYYIAYPSLVIMSVAQVLSTLSGPNGLILLMSGYERKVLFIKSITTFLSLISLPILSKFFGLTGAAMGAALGVISQNIISRIACRKYINIKPSFRSYFFKLLN